MAGKLRTTLAFQSDADLVLDFSLTRAGAPVDLTGCGISLSAADRRATGGFELHVGAGILAGIEDGLVKVRLPKAQMAAKVGDFDWHLRILPPGGAIQSWVIFRGLVQQGAADRAAGGDPLSTGQSPFAPENVVTISAEDQGDGMIQVNSAPGVAGLSALELLVLAGELPAGSTDADFVTWLRDQVRAIMSTTFFELEGTATVAAGATWHGVWRDIGADPGELVSAQRVSVIANCQGAGGDLWFEFSDDIEADPLVVMPSPATYVAPTDPAAVPQTAFVSQDVAARWARPVFKANAVTDVTALQIKTSYT